MRELVQLENGEQFPGDEKDMDPKKNVWLIYLLNFSSCVQLQEMKIVKCWPKIWVLFVLHNEKSRGKQLMVLSKLPSHL